MKKKITIKQTLKNTHSTVDELYEQYHDGMNNYHDNAEKILWVVNQLSKEKQDVFYLYAEYNSLRKVAQECSICYVNVKKIIDEIKQLVKDCKINDFDDNYISLRKEDNYDN